MTVWSSSLKRSVSYCLDGLLNTRIVEVAFDSALHSALQGARRRQANSTERINGISTRHRFSPQLGTGTLSVELSSARKLAVVPDTDVVFLGIGIVSEPFGIMCRQGQANKSFVRQHEHHTKPFFDTNSPFHIEIHKLDVLVASNLRQVMPLTMP